MIRKLDDWIDGYLEYMKDTEHPIPYHIWNAVACVAGALQRRVYMPWDDGVIYPNMFIILVGPSGIGKGQSMRPIIEMFVETGLPTVAEAITTAALITFMQESETKYLDIETGKTIEHSSVQVFARELSVLLGQRDMKKISFITDWYDAHDVWRDSTKTQGKNFIKGVCLNLLGACAPDWFPSILPPEAMGGGFTSRIIFVVETTKAKICPRINYSKDRKRLKEDLTNDLKILAAESFRGPFDFTPEAQELYDSWYIAQEEDIQNNIYPIKDSSFRGYVSRRMLHLRKISIIMAVSRGSEGEILPKDLERAFAILTNAEQKMPRLFGGVGRAVHGAAINAVMQFMLNKGDSSRSEVMRLFANDIDSSNIEIVESSLMYMNFMKPIRVTQGPMAGETRYILNKDFDT